MVTVYGNRLATAPCRDRTRGKVRRERSEGGPSPDFKTSKEASPELGVGIESGIQGKAKV